MLDIKFLKLAEKLRAPLAGTEIMAPILYYLIRSVRPQHVVEFGTGYSTIFILKALADNLSDYKIETEALKKKSASYSTLNIPDKLIPDKLRKWFFDKNAPYYDPEYYLMGYKPQLICFEELPKTHSYTKKVLSVINKLDLGHFLTFIEGSACGQSKKIPNQYLPIDFAWNDNTSYYEFFNEYWDLINSDGGSLIFHNTINSSYSTTLEMEKIQRKLEIFKDYEIINIIEPHKLNQRSFTLIKKTTKSKIYYDQPIYQKKIYNSLLNFNLKF